MKKLLAVILILWHRNSAASELYETHINARAMGMGGAYAAVVDDDEALWYNPASIAKNSGFYWNIADPHVGLSNLQSATALADLKSAATFQSALDSLYGKPIWLGAGGKTSIQIPFLAAAYFYDADSSILVQNPVAPTMNVNFVTDQGYALGTGWSMGGILQMGFNARYITRTGIRKTFGAQTIADIAAGTDSPNLIFDAVTGSKGTGYGLDMGMNLTIPAFVQPTISAVWRNVGNTSFTALAGKEKPPTELQDMSVAAALNVSLPFIHIVPSIEARHVMDQTVQLGKKIHMGVELGIPFIDLRAGLYQGYYSLGVGLKLGLLKIDAATWGTELGAYPGQLQDRRYLVQASIKIGFDFGGGSSGGGSGGSGSGSKSGGGTKRPKKRR